MLPEPDAVHVAPPAPTHVQVQVNAAGNASVTDAPAAGFGPAFVAVTVYVVAPPAATVVTPSVLTMERSAVADPIESLSVPELLAGDGSVTPAGAATVAVFES